jgi:probable F420-dependent oxidoreductase
MDTKNIGKLGLWANIYVDDFPGQINLAQRVEELGYSALWVPDGMTKDPFVSLAAMAVNTDKLFLATGIANIYTRSPVSMTASRDSLGTLSNGRLILGLGVSHPEAVTGMLNMDYRKPLSTMSNYLDGMKPISILNAPSEADLGIVVLAALREKMLKLSATKADGAHPYNVTPEHTAKAREIMGPDSWLAPEQMIMLTTDASVARTAARQHLAVYLGLENYRNNWLELGFEPTDFENGGSDRLIDGTVAWGDETAIMKHIERHWENGADHVCIQPLRPDGQPGYDIKAIEALAPGR